MSYDPEAHGALCGQCPIRNSRIGAPVPPEWNPDPIALVVAERPGPRETQGGAPLVGDAGQELMRCMASVGVKRSQVALTNAILCRPPDDNLDRILHHLQKTNKKRLLRGEEPILTPVQCCTPRLRREVVRLPNVIALGKTPLQALTGRNTSITDARGGPIELGVPAGWGEAVAPFTLRLLPAFNPAHVMRFKRWRGSLRADLGRAFRWFGPGLWWADPKAILVPTPAQVRAFLASVKGKFSIFDVETWPGFPEQEHYDPMYDRLKCFGIGTAEGVAIVIPFSSVETGERASKWYTRAEFEQIVAMLTEYLSSPEWQKGGWNSRIYDALVCKHHFGVYPTPNLDGIALHRVAEPELPHSLGYSGSVYTDVPKWKAGHVATKSADDRELWTYNATDTVVTAKVIPQVAARVRERGMTEQAKTFGKLMDVCRDLHVNGIAVDQAARKAWDSKLLAQAQLHRRQVRELAGMPALNPGSTQQLADLLFEKLRITPYTYSEKTGEPSTDDDSLRMFLSKTWDLDPKTKALVIAVRDFRRVAKRRGVVVRLRPITEAYFEDETLVEFEETEEEREERHARAKKGKNRACGLVLPDGRVHADWNAPGTTGWRFSSSGPNLQNVEDKLRNMFVAAPGRLLVGCDEAQLELRMVAGLARSAYYLEAFNTNKDPHKALCIDVFGPRFLEAAPGQQKKFRRCVKELTYSSLYKAENETKLEVITSAEDEDENGNVVLVFPNFTLREVAAFTDAWLRRNPEIERWWDDIVIEFRRQHFLAEPVMGLRLDFLDGEDVNRLVNYKPQSGGAALVHRAMFRFLEEVPFQKWGPGTGLIQQAHDSLVCEVPEEHPRYRDGVKDSDAPEREFGYCPPGCRCTANRTARLLQDSMSEDGAKFGMPLPFIGEAKIGRNLKEV